MFLNNKQKPINKLKRLFNLFRGLSTAALWYSKRLSLLAFFVLFTFSIECTEVIKK